MEKCYTCRNFNRYYTKGEKKFEATKYGWCCKTVAIVKSGGECGRYVRKPQGRNEKRLLECYLNGLLIEIGELRRLVEAWNEEV